MVREGRVALNEFVKIESALTKARESLEAASESPRLDAELLLSLALDVPRSYLFAHPDDELDPAAATRLSAMVKRRAQGLPMAYITGEKEFWSLPLMVTPDTLVPRPETELLVERALREIPRDAAWRILDLGTGSGAIALAIASERRQCEVVATDISDSALAVAKQNARHLELPNIEFLSGDWADPVRERAFDLILSNPPYVRANHEALANLQYEPQCALVSGDDGLDSIRRIATECLALLAPGRLLIMEHGDDQAASVAEILRAAGWSPQECLNDLAGIPRLTVAGNGADA